MSVQLPWARLYTGSVSAFAQDLTVVLRVKVLDHDNNTTGKPDSLAHEIKMVTLFSLLFFGD